jgi:hypothetical protein
MAIFRPDSRKKKAAYYFQLRLLEYLVEQENREYFKRDVIVSQV